MTPRQRLQALIQGVQQDLGRYQRLCQLLDEQYQLLGTHDVEGLTRFNLTLTGLMGEVQASAQARCQQLRAFGLEPDQQGMASLIGRLPEPVQRRFSPLWLRLEQLLIQCKQKNERNGRLLAGQVETIRQLLGQQDAYPEPMP
ncbi:flagellar export chaperone FlgN [Aeromonas schubertii]|uniref:flagellar export chaperone FlgN n=1 Tax=Aeromonas schubertii TaxID=652 RepID=UPI0038B57B28